jgi:predicted metalloprotease with PDZ domain
MKKAIFLFLAVFISFLSVGQNAPITYTLTFDEAQAHYVDVKMEITHKKKFVDVKMPVWAPGSYLIREFPKNVEGFNAKANNKTLKSYKTDKNTWRVESENAEKIEVNYRVYANELSVRTSFVDASHAYLNGTSVFMYVPALMRMASEVKITPYKGWKEIANSLDMVSGNKWHRKSADYDILVDSPFEIGNHLTFTFDAVGLKHHVAIYGDGNFSVEALKKDMKNVVEKTTAIFGENPCKEYTFIIHNTPSGGGGLEHLNSTTLQTGRYSYGTESGYAGFMSLVAHEYFHLWNVKRLRPTPLGPFNYDAENYTTLLWFSEGFTSYYDDYIAYLAGFYSKDKYLEVASTSAGVHVNTPGNTIQPVAESSWDAWIKFYRPNENSNNSTTSYYSKGGFLALIINFEIINASNGQKSLDDVMKTMYEIYYKKLDRGFTEKELKQVMEQVSGKNMDEFFEMVNTTKAIDANKYFEYAGLKLVDRNATKTDPFVGMNTSLSNGKTMVSSVFKNGPAQKVGISNGDEIIAVNGLRVNNDLNNILQMFNIGEKVEVITARDGNIISYTLELVKTPYVNYKLEKVDKPTDKQKTVYKKWLNTEW